MLDPAVHAQLASVLPESALLTSPEETKPYECDGLTMYRELPAAVALPDNEAQLIEVLRRCHAAGVPVVARAPERACPARAAPQAWRRRRDGEVPQHRRVGSVSCWPSSTG
jgi:glycolate oxidase